MGSRGMDEAKFDRLTTLLKQTGNKYHLKIDTFNHNMQLRLTSEDGAIKLDTWPSTGKYYIIEYELGMIGTNRTRLREKGFLSNDDEAVAKFVGELFFPFDML
jgi:hypothetical protein